ncbi:E3 ubiquitin-protein ligase MARCH6 [Morus notabilis]|uniref:RING-type E3 ubiquitin transferase n=1 Tax=Morus notabilis TaxID=981085 RepID=W9SSE8_9ROSA|nr:E3 ubiquitin-protein ligase MARCH6 [Morus notabilis]
MEDSAAADTADVGGSVVEENECRICRNPGEEGNPLRYPCACRGTIKYVHQDCLLQWLNHRKISHCEVCKHEFVYAPIYATNPPARLSPWEFVLGLAAIVFWLFRILQHFVYLFLVWLVVIPFVTHWIWEFSFCKGFGEAQSLFISHLYATAIFKDCLYGFFLSLGMAYVFLGITFIRVVLRLDPRGDFGLANRIFAANENGENVGGRQGIAKVLLTIKRSLEFLANWWRISVVRIMDYLGIVENELLNELVNLPAPFFPFDENAFVNKAYWLFDMLGKSGISHSKTTMNSTLRTVHYTADKPPIRFTYARRAK